MLFDGVISLGDNDVPVIVGVEESGIRMSSGGSEIGEWPLGEFSIDHDGEGAYIITAENESLRFLPNEPESFAAGLRMEEAPAGDAPPHEQDPESTEAEPATLPAGFDDAPEPKAITRMVFYLIAGGTALMGLWALVSLFA